MPKPDVEYPRRHHRLIGRFPRVMDVERGAVFRLTEFFNRALEGTPDQRPLRGDPADRTGSPAPTGQGPGAAREAGARTTSSGCKRLLFSNDWYPALDRDHVERRHRGGHRASSPTVSGPPTAGCTRPTWSSGAPGSRRPTSSARSRSPAATGVDLGERLVATARTRTSASPCPGFPNLFCVYGPNTNLGGSSIIGDARGAGRLDRPGRPADRRRPPPRRTRCDREVVAAYDREMQEPAGRQHLVRVRQLVHATAADHHELARAWSRSTRPACARSTGTTCSPFHDPDVDRPEPGLPCVPWLKSFSSTTSRA